MESEDPINDLILHYIHAEEKSGEPEGKRRNIRLPLYMDSFYWILTIKRLTWSRKKGIYNAKGLVRKKCPEAEYFMLAREMKDYIQEDHS
jgi:hypothetical protein